MRKLICSWITLVCLAWIAAPAANVTPTGTLLSHTNLVYQGAFRLPEGKFGDSSFAYGGTALAFNSARGIESPAMSFIVNRPENEPGFGLTRQEGPGRQVRYTVTSYAAQKPEGERYS